jgi:ArsR family transcriptional regulator, arsenate/arsenite/antimonite-responsive transcriptional repressor
MENLTDFFKVLSDETRIRILALLYNKELCVCQLCGIMNESQPKISKHLAKLRDLGFVKIERKEKFIYYYLDFENKLFEEILKTIVDNNKYYQIIKNDMDKISTSEKYLEICQR